MKLDPVCYNAPMTERKGRREQTYWSDNELDLVVIKIVGEDEIDLEKLRQRMESVTDLQINTLDEAIFRVCVPNSNPKGRRLLRLNEKALEEYKQPQKTLQKVEK